MSRSFSKTLALHCVNQLNRTIMKRKDFIRFGATIAAGPFLVPVNSWAQEARLQNWAGNITFSTANVQYPKSVAEVQAVVKKHPKLKSLGTRHCFNTIADSK